MPASPAAVDVVVGARPNFVKAAPLMRAMAVEPGLDARLIHTGQHYDFQMSEVFWQHLGLPTPAAHLAVGPGPHGAQTAKCLAAYEERLLADTPACVVVIGDVNSTLACALAAAKLHIPVAHLEAGLRSFDRTMPEEVNRVLTDALAELLWTPAPEAERNLRNEGRGELVVPVGNIIIDCLLAVRDAAQAAQPWRELGVEQGGHGLVTLHRPSNVDQAETLGVIVEALIATAARLPLVFPVHPRTRQSLERHGLWQRLESAPGMVICPPLGYVDFMGLVLSAVMVITDSGGIQTETTFLHKPCLTLRQNLEWECTVEHGTNRLLRPDQLLDQAGRALTGDWPRGGDLAMWDGQTARRVARSLAQRLGGQG